MDASQRQRIRDLIAERLGKGATLDKRSEAFRPFKHLILTGGQKKALRQNKEFARFCELASQNGRTGCLAGGCRAVGRGGVQVEIRARHPVTVARAMFRATVDGGGKVFKVEVLDAGAIVAEEERAHADWLMSAPAR